MKSRSEKSRYCALPARTVRRSPDNTEPPPRDREAGRDVRRLIAAKAPPAPDLSATATPCQKRQDLSAECGWTVRPWTVGRIAPTAEYWIPIFTPGGRWRAAPACTDGTLGRPRSSEAGSEAAPCWRGEWYRGRPWLSWIRRRVRQTGQPTASGVTGPDGGGHRHDSADSDNIVPGPVSRVRPAIPDGHAQPESHSRNPGRRPTGSRSPAGAARRPHRRGQAHAGYPAPATCGPG